MPVVAWLFAGQGAETRLADPAWYLDDPLLQRASDAVSVDIGHLLLRGGPALQRTDVVQALLAAVAGAVARRLTDAGVPVHLAAGHSAGEVAAWSAAGGISPGDSVDIAAARGRAMLAAAQAHPGGMVALGPDIDTAEVLGVGGPTAALAAHNPGQTVFSGSHDAIRRIATAFGGRRVPALGPWHGPAMSAAEPALRAALANVQVGPARAELISNHTGAVADSREFAQLLLRQLTHPVRWTQCLGTLARRGVTDVVAVAPGKLLAQQARLALRGVRVHRAEAARDLDALMEACCP